VTLEQRVRELTAALAHAHTALQALRDQEELRGRALHHRVMNDLQVVVSLPDWHEQELQDPRARAVFEACQGRIRAIALVHALLYRAGDGEHLDLGQYLGRLASPLFEAYGVDSERIRLTLQADTVSVAADIAIPCGLLVHEVLVNCVQHAFPSPHRGGVTITLRVAPQGQATLTVRDTGIGWPGHRAVGAAEGFGLQLIRGLTEQLHGVLMVTRDQGTCVTLRFPV
jgi:two-component sensor histidine kinase